MNTTTTDLEDAGLVPSLIGRTIIAAEANTCPGEIFHGQAFPDEFLSCVLTLDDGRLIEISGYGLHTDGWPRLRVVSPLNH